MNDYNQVFSKFLAKLGRAILIVVLIVGVADIGVLAQRTAISNRQIKSLYESQMLTLIRQGKLIAGLTGTNENLNKVIDNQLKSITIQARIINNLKKYKTIDLKDYKKIREANIYIGNKTMGAGGSGTRIKMGDKHYILTCAHLIGKETDDIRGQWDNKDISPLKLLKYDREMDLALFLVTNPRPGVWLEISSEEPKSGSEVTVIGNPGGNRNVITLGNVCKKINGMYMFTNIIFFGNSGGAILYKGKIVGVISTISSPTYRGVQVHYGYASSLTNIQKFLKEYTV